MKNKTHCLLLILISLLAGQRLNAQINVIYGNNASYGPDVVEKFDLNTGALLQSYTVSPGNGRGVVVVGNIMYTTIACNNQIYMTDATTGISLGSIATGVSCMSTLAWDGSHFWTTDYSGANKGYRLDIAGTVVKTITLPLASSFMDGMEYFNGKLIVNRCDACGVYDIYDLDGNVLTANFISTGTSSTGIAFDGQNFIVSDIFLSRLSVWDGTTGAFIKYIPLPDPSQSSAGRLIEDLSVDYNQRPDTSPCTVTCPTNTTVCNDPGRCGAIVNYPPPTTSGDCDELTACSPASGSFFPVGSTTVTCTAADASGNTNSCSFTVTVIDCEPPTITCPNDIVTCNEPGKPSAVVTFRATATDNCGVATVVCAPPSGSTFPIGTTPVTCTATDRSGNSSRCSFTVTVKDCEGRWTGGGSVIGTATSIGVPVGGRVTHGFELHCDPAMLPNHLQVNWKDASGKEHKFHLETLTIGFCTDDPTITPNPPNAFSDTYIGKGTGRLDGNPGATAEWKFTDAGEPGKNDTAQITIKDGSSTTVLSVSGNLDKGNHQAH